MTRSATLALVAAALLSSACAKKEPSAPAAATPSAPPAAANPQPAAAPTAAGPDVNAAKNLLSAAQTEAQKSGNEAARNLQSNLAAAENNAGGPSNEALALAQQQAQALAAQATELLAQYTGEFDTLTNGAKKLKSIIDQHSAMLPAGVKQKYDELNGLLPQLNGMLGSLKSYQNVDLTTLVPKVKADFAKAQQLYKDALALVPADMLK